MPTKTWASGNVLTSTDLNTYLRDWGTQASCVAWAAGTQTATNGTTIDVTWSASEDFDTDGIHSTSVNSHLFTPTISGIYTMNAAVEVNNAIGGTFRRIWIVKNGSLATNYGYHQDLYTLNNFNWCLQIHSVPVAMNGSTDTLGAKFLQDSGGTRTLVWGYAAVNRVRS